MAQNTPTQAQIEAAKCTHDFCEREAAIETEGYCPLCMAIELSQLRRYIALTAAAEMGEQQPDDTFAHGACVMKERCAQVAESGIQLTSGGNLIAAAIRALKEER